MKFFILLLCSVCLVFSKSSRNYKRGNLAKRIIGGTTATLRDWSFLVNLNFYQQKPIIKICGGSLISRNFVLTAASCIEDIPHSPESITVSAFSDLSLNNQTEGKGKNFTISKIILHPKFVLPASRSPQYNFSIDHDIAILKLSASVGGNGIPIAIADQENDVYSQKSKECKIAGWGISSMNEEITQTDGVNLNYNITTRLQETSIDVVSKVECMAKHKDISDFVTGRDFAHVICARSSDDKRNSSPCGGDNGSPLVCKGNSDTVVLQGVFVASSDECKAETGSFLFTQVSKYKKWIDEVLQTE